MNIENIILVISNVVSYINVHHMWAVRVEC